MTLIEEIIEMIYLWRNENNRNTPKSVEIHISKKSQLVNELNNFIGHGVNTQEPEGLFICGCKIKFHDCDTKYMSITG